MAKRSQFQTPEYTPERHAKLTDALRVGVFPVHAAALAGLTLDELNEWLTLGRAGREPYAQLARDVAEAIAHDVRRNHLVISRAALGQSPPTADWRAAAWLLERKHPDHYILQTVRQRAAGAPPVEHERPISPYPSSWRGEA
jgi:hypothetical protein